MDTSDQNMSSEQSSETGSNETMYPAHIKMSALLSETDEEID